MRALAQAAGDARLALLLTVRFEDLRQRHPLDSAGDLSAAAIRDLARCGAGVRLVVSAAGRETIEEVHWALTPEEQRRVVWDISWIWGPPEDHLAKLFRTDRGRTGSCTGRSGRCVSPRRRAPIWRCCPTISPPSGSPIPIGCSGDDGRMRRPVLPLGCPSPKEFIDNTCAKPLAR